MVSIAEDLVMFAFLFWLFFNPRLKTLILISFLNFVLSVEQEAYEAHKVMPYNINARDNQPCHLPCTTKVSPFVNIRVMRNIF